MAPRSKVVVKKSLGGSLKSNDYEKRRLKLKNEYRAELHKIDKQELQELHMQMNRNLQQLETLHDNLRESDENKENVEPTNKPVAFNVMPLGHVEPINEPVAFVTRLGHVDPTNKPVAYLFTDSLDAIMTEEEEEEEEEEDDEITYDADAVIKLIDDAIVSLSDTTYRRTLRRRTIRYFKICNDYGLDAKNKGVFKRIVNTATNDSSKYGQAHRACDIDMGNDWMRFVLTGINKID